MNQKKNNNLEEIQKKRQILQSIIQNDGRCFDLAGPVDCMKCPLRTMLRREDGSWYSCTVVVANLVGKDSLNTADTDWKEAAIKVLMDLEIEEMLLSDPAGQTDSK